MGIYKVIECDVCGKKERLGNPYRKPWYLEVLTFICCSKECYNKSARKENKK